MDKGKVIAFTNFIKQSLSSGSFVRLSLGGYKGKEPELKKITARRVIIKGAEKISFTLSYKTRDITKNDSIPDGLARITDALHNGFTVATLFDTQHDIQYPTLKKSKPSNKETPAATHDIAKRRHVETKGKPYLHALGITDDQGNVYKNAQDKYKQIDKYIDILGGLIKGDKPLRIADMGSGKGYLTFALYDYLHGKGVDAQITGVEYRNDLVDLCNDIAKKSGFKQLHFAQGTIQDFDASDINVLIALHACDTATDDAIAKGVKAGAELIVVAPCCHKQIRREIEAGKKVNDLDFILKYGTLLERQAEMATDAMRGLLLEASGYSVKIFEFISDAHTPKNMMIVAQKTGKKNPAALKKFNAAKEFFGIGEHALEKELG